MDDVKQIVSAGPGPDRVEMAMKKPVLSGRAATAKEKLVMLLAEYFVGRVGIVGYYDGLDPILEELVEAVEHDAIEAAKSRSL